jgi:ABC-type glutathione transport system ATPase component
MNNLSFLSSTAQALNRSLDQAGKEQPKYIFKQPLSKQNPKPPISTSIERELDKHSEQKRSKKKTQEPRKKIDLA